MAASAFCAVRLLGRPSTATLAVAVHATHTADRGLAVLGAAEALRREGRHQSVVVRTVGSHPAVVAVAERRSGPADRVPEESRPIVRELTVVVPVPGYQHAAMLTLATPCLRDWDTYEQVLLDACRTMHVRRGAAVGIH